MALATVLGPVRGPYNQADQLIAPKNILFSCFCAILGKHYDVLFHACKQNETVMKSDPCGGHVNH